MSTESQPSNEGEYAKVYEIKGKIIKISKDSFDKILTSEVREASFLRHAQFPFIPKIYSIKENNDKVEIEMEKNERHKIVCIDKMGRSKRVKVVDVTKKRVVLIEPDCFAHDCQEV